ncbi:MULTISPECIES: hypothetical protein [unclassified Duganella]|uniref:hypothetical protein n=1 Tax=unclassified Duganella TaxID=2636909 RepID=UPI000B7ED84B|nr:MULTISPECIES: hypothetical protein [unclassified Duganella]
MPSKTNAYAATLDLVCTPLANSLVSHITGNKQAEAILRESDFYMIAGRAQASFKDFDFDNDSGLLSFTIEVAGGKSDRGAIDIPEFFRLKGVQAGWKYSIRPESSQIGVFVQESDNDKAKIIQAFIPDDVLMRRGRKDELILGFDNFLDLATYDLLYVGIAKVGDTYDRLFASAHKARTQILSDEPQRFPGARVSDEIYLFAFKVEPLLMRVFTEETEIENDDVDFSYDPKRLVADAEKAVVSLLKPRYNRELYPNYPKGKDGLYNTGLTSYSYSISEGMAFRTAYGTIKGGRRKKEFTISSEADYISVQGDNVTFRISGIDFLAGP